MPDDETPDDTSTPKGKILQYRRPEPKKTQAPVYINDAVHDELNRRMTQRIDLITVHLQRLQEQVDIVQASLKYFSIISGSMLGVAILLILLGSG